MSDRPTPAALAKRYLDLWDRQCRAMATDPDWAAVIKHWNADRASAPAPHGDAQAAKSDEEP